MYEHSLKLLISCLQVFISLGILLVSSNTFSHGGGLDTNGGHNDKKLGDYHCHRDYCQPKVNAAKVIVKKRDYDRKQWRHWVDGDGDCQNTRAELLISTSIKPVFFRNNKGCSVLSGKWYGVYSGKYWSLASDLDIDHIVPLYWAYNHGGSKWGQHKKSKFANDIENLLAVEDGLNQAKGAKGPNKWMPLNKRYQCEYVKKFDEIVNKYRLTYNPVESRYILRFLKQCAI